jgi:hypothetical protein
MQGNHGRAVLEVRDAEGGGVVDMSERVDRLEQFQREGKLIRKDWGDGKERACLLVAMVPEVGTGQFDACPAGVMPEWLARITPWIDDAGSAEAWPGVIIRYAAVARRWSALSARDWELLDCRVRAICVREAIRHTTSERAIQVCREVIALLDRAAAGELVTKKEWNASATEAASASAEAASASAWAEAAEAAWASAWAAAGAGAGAAAAAAAAAAETEAAADRIIDAILSEIERTVTAAAGRSE